MRVKAINKGIFVCLVTKESPAAIGGLRSFKRRGWASFVIKIG